MPQNPVDYLVERIPASILSASSKLQEVRAKMNIVNLSDRASYQDGDMEPLDDVVELLTKIASRLAERNAVVAAETKKFDADERKKREIARTSLPSPIQATEATEASVAAALAAKLGALRK